MFFWSRERIPTCILLDESFCVNSYCNSIALVCSEYPYIKANLNIQKERRNLLELDAVAVELSQRVEIYTGVKVQSFKLKIMLI